MAHTTVHHAHPGLVDYIAQAFATLRASVRGYVVYRRTFNELSNLTDRELADVGLSRDDIEEVAAQTARG